METPATAAGNDLAASGSIPAWDYFPGVKSAAAVAAAGVKPNRICQCIVVDFTRRPVSLGQCNNRYCRQQ